MCWVFVNIKIQFWCFISAAAEMCNFMLFKALWTSQPSVDFSLPDYFFSLFTSHALSPGSSNCILNSSWLQPWPCFAEALVGSIRAPRTEWFVVLYSLSFHPSELRWHSEMLVSFQILQLLLDTYTFLLAKRIALSRVHFSCSGVSIFIQLHCVLLPSHYLTPTHPLSLEIHTLVINKKRGFKTFKFIFRI